MKNNILQNANNYNNTITDNIFDIYNKFTSIINEFIFPFSLFPESEKTISKPWANTQRKPRWKTPSESDKITLLPSNFLRQ